VFSGAIVCLCERGLELQVRLGACAGHGLPAITAVLAVVVVVLAGCWSGGIFFDETGEPLRRVAVNAASALGSSPEPCGSCPLFRWRLTSAPPS
jgi:hypothetical protein